MTVSSTQARKTFAGNGVTTAFGTSPIVFFDEGDLNVYVVVDATGTPTLQTITTHYTVSGGDGATGTVTMLTAPAAGETLVIERDVAATQDADFVNNDNSDAEVAEDAFDRLTMIVQQILARMDRVLRQPAGESDDIAELPNVVDRASMYLGFDSSGDPVALAAPAGTTAVSAAWATAIGTSGSIPTFPAAVAFPDGTAAAPAIRFTNDPDTGIYLSGTNTLAFTSAGQITGTLLNTSGNRAFNLNSNTSGAYAEIGASNGSNTASSQALLSATVAGTSAADPFAKFVITGGTSWALGADNSDSDAFVVSKGIALGTDNVLRVDVPGAIQTGGVAAAATGYAAYGSITLPAAGAIRAKNTDKAWAYVTNSGTTTLVDSFNVTSITDNGTGDTSVNLTNATTDANGSATATVLGTNFGRVAVVHSKTTTVVRVITDDGAAGSADQNFSMTLKAA